MYPEYFVRMYPIGKSSLGNSDN